MCQKHCLKKSQNNWRKNSQKIIWKKYDKIYKVIAESIPTGTVGAVFRKVSKNVSNVITKKKFTQKLASKVFGAMRFTKKFSK